MYAFLPTTALPLPARHSPSVSRRTSVQPLRQRSRNLRMLTMDDLPESLRIPDRPRIGFTDYSEKMNGRFAMIGFVAALAIELLTDEPLVPKLLALFGQ